MRKLKLPKEHRYWQVGLKAMFVGIGVKLVTSLIFDFFLKKYMIILIRYAN